jgi:hypothetical protein
MNVNIWSQERKAENSDGLSLSPEGAPICTVLRKRSFVNEVVALRRDHSRGGDEDKTYSKSHPVPFDRLHRAHR